MNPVEAYYERNAAREWERLERHRTEFAVTCRALDDFLPPPPGRILDVGGGPRRYAIHLTKLGYHITLLDLSQKNLDLALEKSIGEGIYLPPPVRGDALDLPKTLDGEETDNWFDAVLLMGPLYHLLRAEDRLKAIHEARRVLRPGGLIFAAFLTRFAPLRDLAVHSPAWILEHPDRFGQLLDQGLNRAHESSTFPDSYFIHPDDIVPFMALGGFRAIALLSCEGLVAGHEAAVNDLTGELWSAWVNLNYRLSQEPALRGAADHLLFVGSKPPQTPLPSAP